MQQEVVNARATIAIAASVAGLRARAFWCRLGSAKAMQKCVSVFRQQTKELGRSFLLEAVRHCIKSLQQAAHDDSQLGAIAASREAIRVSTFCLVQSIFMDDSQVHQGCELLRNR